MQANRIPALVVYVSCNEFIEIRCNKYMKTRFFCELVNLELRLAGKKCLNGPCPTSYHVNDKDNTEN